MQRKLSLVRTSVLLMCYGTSLGRVLHMCLISCVCDCMHTCMCVHICMYECLCVYVCLCAGVGMHGIHQLTECWLTHLLTWAVRTFSSGPVVLTPTHFFLVPASQRCCQGGSPVRSVAVIPFPYMEFHVYSLYLCQLLLCIEVVELLLIQHAY